MWPWLLYGYQCGHGYFSYACYAWIPFKVAMSAAVSENP